MMELMSMYRREKTGHPEEAIGMPWCGFICERWALTEDRIWGTIGHLRLTSPCQGHDEGSTSMRYGVKRWEVHLNGIARSDNGWWAHTDSRI